MAESDGSAVVLVPEIADRRARRGIATRPVDAAVINRVATAATLAPSCANKQPWRFVLVREAQQLTAVRAALTGGNYWAERAPLLVVVATADDLDCRLDDRRDYAAFDTGMATMNLMLQSQKEGLIAHPMAGFDPAVVRAALAIPPEFVIYTLVAVGYADPTAELTAKHQQSETEERSRKPLDSVVTDDRWGW